MNEKVQETSGPAQLRADLFRNAKEGDRLCIGDGPWLRGAEQNLTGRTTIYSDERIISIRNFRGNIFSIVRAATGEIPSTQAFIDARLCGWQERDALSDLPLVSDFFPRGGSINNEVLRFRLGDDMMKLPWISDRRNPKGSNLESNSARGRKLREDEEVSFRSYDKIEKIVELMRAAFEERTIDLNP